MQRLNSVLTFFLLSVPITSAQITSGGSSSISGLLTDLLGINFSQPYVAIGFTATFGLMWVSVYIIFKTGIKRIDSGYGGRRSNPLGDALGLKDDSRNLLAVLTLLITLSMVGTGAFYGMLRGWQSLILMAFSFMLLAGLLFILIGGTGGLIGGTAYVTGKSAKLTSEGLRELKEQADELMDEEETLDELEEEISEEEEDARRREEKKSGQAGQDSQSEGEDGGNRRSGSGHEPSDSDSGSTSGSSEPGGTGSTSETGRTEAEIKDILEKLEKAFNILEDIEEKLSKDLEAESKSIDNRIQQLKELRKVLNSKESPYRDLREIIETMEREGLDSSSSDEELKNAIEDLELPEAVGEKEIREYISELESLKRDIEELESELKILKEIESLLEKLQEEVGGAEEEEEFLKRLISNLGESNIKNKFIERLSRDEEELNNIEERFKNLGKFSEKIKEFFSFLSDFQEEMGQLEDLIDELNELRYMAEKLGEFYTSHSKIKFLSFSPEDQNYIREGTEFTVPGSSEDALVDLNLDMPPSRKEKPEQFEEPFRSLLRDITPPLSKEFKKENKGIDTGERVKQHRRLGRDDRSVKWMLVTIFEIIQNMQTLPSDVNRNVQLSRQISKDNKYSSELINSIYLGALLQHVEEVYSMVMKLDDTEKTGKALTRESIGDYIGKSKVKLSSYTESSGGEPIVIVKHEDDRYGFLIRTGKFVQNIEDSKIRGVYLNQR